MASINVDPPVTTPAHEWAASTADALAATRLSSTADAHPPPQTPASTASTPGSEFPGAFPRDANSQYTNTSAVESFYASSTPRAALDHLADAAPPDTVLLDANGNVDLARTKEVAAQYLPAREDIQRTLASGIDTAREYLPERVVGALGSALRACISADPRLRLSSCFSFSLLWTFSCGNDKPGLCRRSAQFYPSRSGH
ncbi:hypothetical protein DFH11DRAFT_315334 [Phellopilus nigrolimitatus]|nr:hypothetical protein DFH11DRAFT_315334 [Phellopilus nigrolimitatus]